MTDHDKALVERLERIVFITEGEEISDAISRIKAQAAEIENAAAKERAKIVAWLRETQDAFQKLMDLRKYPLVSKHHMEHCKHSADAIEAGEHLK